MLLPKLRWVLTSIAACLWRRLQMQVWSQPGFAAPDEARREARYKAQYAARWEREREARLEHERRQLREALAAQPIPTRANGQARHEEAEWAQTQIGRRVQIESRSARRVVEGRLAFRDAKFFVDYEVRGEQRQKQICSASTQRESIRKLRHFLGEGAGGKGGSAGPSAAAAASNETEEFLRAHRLHGYASFVARDRGYSNVADLVSAGDRELQLLAIEAGMRPPEARRFTIAVNERAVMMQAMAVGSHRPIAGATADPGQIQSTSRRRAHKQAVARGRASAAAISSDDPAALTALLVDRGLGHHLHMLIHTYGCRFLSDLEHMPKEELAALKSQMSNNTERRCERRRRFLNRGNSKYTIYQKRLGTKKKENTIKTRRCSQALRRGGR